MLAAYARSVIELAVQSGQPTESATQRRVPPPPEFADLADRPHGGAFVTIHKFDRLRGCMGILDTSMPLADALHDAAVSAALHDPRFPPVAADELADIRIEVSVLSPHWPMRTIDELQPGVHGVMVRSRGRRGLFLPQVATEHHLDREAFVSRCCEEKAGLPPDAWRDSDVEVFLFTAHVERET